MCIRIYPEYLHEYCVHVWCLQKQEERRGHQILGTKIADSHSEQHLPFATKTVSPSLIIFLLLFFSSFFSD